MLGVKPCTKSDAELGAREGIYDERKKKKKKWGKGYVPPWDVPLHAHQDATYTRCE